MENRVLTKKRLFIQDYLFLKVFKNLRNCSADIGTIAGNIEDLLLFKDFTFR
jgi:hypothetical protein